MSTTQNINSESFSAKRYLDVGNYRRFIPLQAPLLKK